MRLLLLLLLPLTISLQAQHSEEQHSIPFKYVWDWWWYGPEHVMRRAICNHDTLTVEHLLNRSKFNKDQLVDFQECAAAQQKLTSKEYYSNTFCHIPYLLEAGKRLTTIGCLFFLMYQQQYHKHFVPPLLLLKQFFPFTCVAVTLWLTYSSMPLLYRGIFYKIHVNETFLDDTSIVNKINAKCLSTDGSKDGSHLKS